MCERAVATRHVEPRTALEVLHYADAAGAGALKRYVGSSPAHCTPQTMRGLAGGMLWGGSHSRHTACSHEPVCRHVMRGHLHQSYIRPGLCQPHALPQKSQQTLKGNNVVSECQIDAARALIWLLTLLNSTIAVVSTAILTHARLSDVPHWSSRECACGRHCFAVALANLDAVVLEARAAVESLPPHLLDELEGAVKAHLRRGVAGSSGASPLSPRGAVSTRQAPFAWRLAGSPPRAGRPTAAPTEYGVAQWIMCLSAC